MLTEAQNCKYKVNILQVKQKYTIWVFSVAILAPDFCSANPNFQLRPKFGCQVSLWTEF